MNLSVTSSVFALIWAVILIADSYFGASQIQKSTDLIISTMFLLTSWLIQVIEEKR